MKLEIFALADCPEAASRLAAWMAAEWGGAWPASLAAMRRELSRRMNRAVPPMAWAAFVDGELAGAVSLVRQEIETLPQYEYWLAGLYVHHPYRRRGVGRELVRQACQMACRLGVKRLHLYTRSAANQAYYRRLGWRVVESIRHGGRPAVVMVRDLRVEGVGAPLDENQC